MIILLKIGVSFSVLFCFYSYKKGVHIVWLVFSLRCQEILFLFFLKSLMYNDIVSFFLKSLLYNDH